MHHIKYYSMKLFKFSYVDTSLIVCKMWQKEEREENGEEEKGQER